MRELPIRKPNRLTGYDYSKEGAYFITICAKDRAEIFGHIVCDLSNEGARSARPHLSEIGLLVDSVIGGISDHYPHITVAQRVIMPNHIHMILVIDRFDGRAMRAPTTVGIIINQMKGIVTKKIGFSPWQKSFHDHIIRNEKDYFHIAEYIENNPQNWEKDQFYQPMLSSDASANHETGVVNLCDPESRRML